MNPMLSLLLPLIMIQAAFALMTGYFESSDSVLPVLFNYVAAAFIVVIAGVWLKSFSTRFAQAVFLSGLMALIVTESANLGLVAFSGNGFTSEVFYHFEPTAFAVGWSEYKVLIILELIVSIPLALFFSRRFKAIPIENRFMPARVVLFSIAILAFFGSTEQSPFYQAGTAWLEYRAYSLEVDAPDKQDFARYIELDVVNSTGMLHKKYLEVEEPSGAKNLILIYLESFNDGLTDHPRYPQLTPYINKLKQRYASTSRHYTSSFVTIEGLISSQCGTLLPMFRAGDSFMNSSKSMSNMACLGDILGKAGYQQFYFVGSKEEFAGTDQFLAAHGYDEIRGWDYWRSKGRKPEFESWGLSDSDLFDAAYQKIKNLNGSNTLYNLTLATIGTHVPGFFYRACKPYNEEADQFLNAVHCTDQLLEKFITRLEVSGFLENTLVYIVGDHGVFHTKYMRNLFGDMVEDKRILTIAFPAPQLIDNWVMGTYDIAPTILDLLEVRHNQSFFYGRSSVLDNSQKNYVTRKDDWIKGELKNNQPGECSHDLEIGEQPMNSCYKANLLRLTQRVLNSFGERPSDHLSCIYFDLVRVKHKRDSSEYDVTISGKSAYKTFTEYGAYIRDIKPGFYLIELNKNNDILDKSYFSLDERPQYLLSNQLNFWNTDNQMILIYLPDLATNITPVLSEALRKLQISAEHGAVYIYQPHQSGPALKTYPINNFPFSLDRDTCNELFQ